MIPASRLYAPGVAVLDQLPAAEPHAMAGHELQLADQSAPTYNQLLQQPAVKIDYQATAKLRLSGKFSGQLQRSVVTPGLIPGFSDAYVPYPYITNYGVTVDLHDQPEDVHRGDLRADREPVGGRQRTAAFSPTLQSNRLTSLKDFPELYPNAGVMNTGYYGYQVMQSTRSRRSGTASR